MAKSTVSKSEKLVEVALPEVVAEPKVKVVKAPETKAQIVPGSIVHYVLPNGKHRPAIVVFLEDGKGIAKLQVFTNGIADVDQLPDARNGLVLKGNVEYSKEPTPNTWHWMEQ